jgi:hypothetical protein
MLPRKEQRCGNCDAAFPNGREILCRANPPTPIFYGIGQTSVLSTEQTAIIRAHFPPMQRSGWCGQWRMKVEGEG